MTEPGSNIIGRFAVVYIFVIVILVFPIFYTIFKIQFFEREEWMKLAIENRKKEISVRANRGNIYSHDGQLMASSIPIYSVFMDMRVEALQLKNNSLFYENVDDLAEALSAYFKDKSKEEYKKGLIKAFKKGDGSYQFYKNRISYAQLRDIKTFPLFRLGQNKSGLISKEYFQRVKPFGSLSSRTIGDIYSDESKGGKNGLELGLDSILRGKPGLSMRQKVANRFEDIIVTEPEDGFDVVSTIDINIQEIAESSLLTKLKEIDAKVGYAIVMEVKTGEIKAIVNMMKDENGNYSEQKNGAIADKVEPGSTFKVASLMAVLDDGKAELSDLIETGNGFYKFGSATMKDHNTRSGGFQTISLEAAINGSSNIGISKTIVKAYGNNPEKFIEKLYKMGLNEPFDLYLPGVAAPYIKHPKDKNAAWSAISLPWISTGYEVQLAPIYTLAFFNAIANNGKFIEPLFVKSISKNGMTVKDFQARVINPQICKPSTLSDVRKTLLGVVENPTYGTAKKVYSPYVRIAGKTGTAQISKGEGGYKSGGTSHQVSFCAFFPYENPEYTCIVVIREPKIGYPSGGAMSGAVVKNIAERITAYTANLTIHNYKLDSIFKKTDKMPTSKIGDEIATNYVLSKINDKNFNGKEKQKSSSTISINEKKFNSIPNFYGYGLKDALYLSEKNGLKVNFSGKGKVISQSLKAGEKFYKGQEITFVLQ